MGDERVGERLGFSFHAIDNGCTWKLARIANAGVIKHDPVRLSVICEQLAKLHHVCIAHATGEVIVCPVAADNNLA